LTLSIPASPTSVASAKSDDDDLIATPTESRLIKLVGIPSVDNIQNSNITTDENGANISSVTATTENSNPTLTTIPQQATSPTIIRPPLPSCTGAYDHEGRPIVDVIDSFNEDPFTLETFEKLIRLHAKAGKDFIIARVTTVDPQDSTRFYYSYYAAHHINKVLFRTQPEEVRIRAKFVRALKTSQVNLTSGSKFTRDFYIA
jgi:hypothetical protein